MARAIHFIDILSITAEGSDLCILSESTGERLSIYEVDDFDAVVQIYAEGGEQVIVVDA